MNILISNGSPRKKGLISQMLNIMQAEAETRGDKLLFDRIVYGMMRDTPRFPEPLMKGKKCILLSTCTTPWP